MVTQGGAPVTQGGPRPRLRRLCVHECVCAHLRACLQMCVHVYKCMCVYTYARVHECPSVLECLCAVHLSRQCWKLSGCRAGWPGSSLIMPDRLIRGESCCVSITTDRGSVSALNLSLHTGMEGVQAGVGRRGLASVGVSRTEASQRGQGASPGAGRERGRNRRRGMVD